MPYIEVKTSAALTDAKCEAIKAGLGSAISAIPGKSESWLMVGIVPNCKMWFRGDDSADTAMVTVAVLGKVSAADSEKMTAEVTKVLEREAGLSPDRIYISYSEHDKWGWNSSNF